MMPFYHLPISAKHPEVCAHPSNCTLGVHVTTVEEAAKLRERRDDAYGSLAPVFTKADLPQLRECLRTGEPFFDFR
ncbi:MULTISPECIES: hypothetical protein [unclassified Curtobacterium]|uniref:hypothetical protein n=1 Tax=unclassified Curtobacterium TaxID=257496 RepID=UPI0038046008